MMYSAFCFCFSFLTLNKPEVHRVIFEGGRSLYAINLTWICCSWCCCCVVGVCVECAWCCSFCCVAAADARRSCSLCCQQQRTLIIVVVTVTAVIIIVAVVVGVIIIATLVNIVVIGTTGGSGRWQNGTWIGLYARPQLIVLLIESAWRWMDQARIRRAEVRIAGGQAGGRA